MSKAKKQEAAAVWMSADDLTPWADNPRSNDHAVPEVAKSIKRFGFASPIIARPIDGGGFEIIAGHTRHQAALSLGLDRVPVRVMDLDPTDAKLLALADNKVGEIATWSDGLNDILQELDASGVDLDGLGFSDADLDELLAPLPIEPDGSEDDVPEVQDEAHSQPGEVYELGPHRLACGDCTDPAVWDAVMQGEDIDAVLTDPPYGIGASTMTMGAGQSAKPKYLRLSDSESTWDDEAPDVAWLAHYPFTVIWGGNYFDLPLSEDWLVWHKNNDGRSFSEGELAWTNLGKKVRHLTHHWGGERKQHITQKPIKVMDWCLSYFPQGCSVMDPFGGSGTTLIACAMTGRVARLIELDPRYCDVIRRRWTAWAKKHGQDPGPGALE